MWQPGHETAAFQELGTTVCQKAVDGGLGLNEASVFEATHLVHHGVVHQERHHQGERRRATPERDEELAAKWPGHEISTHVSMGSSSTPVPLPPDRASPVPSVG